MPRAPRPSLPSDGLAARLRRAFFDLRTEYTSAGREAAAVGVGIFIGCTPFFGFHLLICWGTAFLLRLNRLHVYLAANISNPLFAPFLIFAELQTGALVRRGGFQSLTLAAIREHGGWSFGLDYLVGAFVVGGVLGAMAAAGTYAALRGSANDPVLAALVPRAAERYVSTSITAWEFARGKLRGDPVYRRVLSGGLLPSGGTLVDIGCGQGLMLALLAEARELAMSGGLTPGFSPPVFDRLVGVELRPRVARLARQALGEDAEILEQDARTLKAGSCRAVLFFDVLHMMPREDQDALLAGMAKVLEPGGVILIRDADASGGWRFAAVRAVNRIKALAFGAWSQQFHFRTNADWLACFARLGFDAELRPMADGTPFANVLFRLTARREFS